MPFPSSPSKHCSNCNGKRVIEWNQPTGNPDPKNFVINDVINKENYLILDVIYPDATNFEGRKIMVYKGYKDSGLLISKAGNKLDPHFSSDDFSPIARFLPNEDGMAMALAFVDTLIAKDNSVNKKFI